MSRVMSGVKVRDSRPGEIYPLTIYADDPGVRNNPRECVFSDCAVHNMRSPRAWVGYQVSIFGIPLPDGSVEFVRFRTPIRVSRAVRAYDKDGTPIPPGVYVFPALPASARQDAVKARNRKRINGSRAKNPGSRPNTANGRRRDDNRRRNAPRGTYPVAA